MLYVYAVLGDAPPEPGQGLRGEPLRLLSSGSLFVAVGPMEEAPPIGNDTIRRFDATVRRLATLVEAILPVRFGTHLATEREVHERLADRQSELSRALELVRGREQMTVRIFHHGPTTIPGKPPSPSDVSLAESGQLAFLDASSRGDPRVGPGTQFLRARQETHRRAHTAPELEPLRPLLAPLVFAERVERHDAGPLVATVFHLITCGTVATYLEQVTATGVLTDDLRVTVTGPWPPYAFAPETLG